MNAFPCTLVLQKKEQFYSIFSSVQTFHLCGVKIVTGEMEKLGPWGHFLHCWISLP